MPVPAYRRLLVVGCILALGCHGPRLKDFPNPVDLYVQSMRWLEAGKTQDAIAGFEKLTLELPARDTLLPRAHFYLGRAHARRKDWLLAGQAFNRMASEFPDDSLADDALLEAGNAYARIWDDPELDPTYGQSAIAVYTTLLDTYPTSSLRGAAEAGVRRMQAQLAEKDFRIAEHYRRRGNSPHSAIVYYKQLINTYPEAPRAKDAYIRMAEVYKKIGYDEDFKDICDVARGRYQNDAGIRAVCGNPPVVATPAAPATTPPPS
jgi:outer membrane assembly lipoprotein YfiO